MKIQKSAEDYLETILILLQRNGVVRSIDIANELNFSKPSVSIAMKRLRENGYITVDELGDINLTQSGMSIAKCIYERHKLLTEFLVELGVCEETARCDACKIEHDISPESFEKIKQHYLKNHGDLL